jgi:hypothetical protein
MSVTTLLHAISQTAKNSGQQHLHRPSRVRADAGVHLRNCRADHTRDVGARACDANAGSRACQRPFHRLKKFALRVASGTSASDQNRFVVMGTHN